MMKEHFPFEDMLGPLPAPPLRARTNATSFWLEALIAGKGWVPIAYRSGRRWHSNYKNLGIVDEDGDIGVYEIKS